jgi:hypothetical protein
VSPPLQTVTGRHGTELPLSLFLRPWDIMAYVSMYLYIHIVCTRTSVPTLGTEFGQVPDPRKFVRTSSSRGSGPRPTTDPTLGTVVEQGFDPRELVLTRPRGSGSHPKTDPPLGTVVCLNSAKLRSTDSVNPRTVLSRVRPRYRHLL